MAETAAKPRGGMFLLQKSSPSDVLTPEDLNEEQQMIAKTTRQFADKVRGMLPQIEKDKPKLSRQLLKEAGDLGLLALEVPEDYGGVGLDKATASAATAELGRSGPFGVTIGAHVGIGTYPIVYFGTPEQKAAYLPKLVTGDWVAAYALTESGSGSDAQGARTSARLTSDGKHWELNGTKQWITNSGFADLFVVYAKVDGEKFSAFIVERTFPGVSIGPEENKMGLHASSTCSLILEDVKVPVENLLGEVGRGHIIAFNVLNIGRWKLGAGVIGSTHFVLEEAATYAKTRKQFGQPIAEFRAIQQKLADMNVLAYMNETGVYRTAGYYDTGLSELDERSPDYGRESARCIAEFSVEASINKIVGSEALDFCVDEAVQIHGGYGFMEEYPVAQAYRDSRINRIFEGTNEINRLLILDTLMKRTMKGELPLMQAMTGLQDELMTMTPYDESDEPLAKENFLLDRAKKVFLMAAGLAAQKYQLALQHEQELLLGAADLVIEVYNMESVVLRAQKALAAGKPGLKVVMAQIYCQDAFERIGTIARTMLPAIEEEGDLLRTQLSLLKRLLRYTPINTIVLKRQVAAQVLEREGYVH